MKAKTLMIQGTASNVGKSLLVAAYCRLFTRAGLKVAPFKAQNMALNSFVTPSGLELGRAQALQAQAAFREPDIRMNPILLKPEANYRSQIVLMGKPLKSTAGSSYYKERNSLWPHVAEAMDSLRAENDLLIVEGAGSPAEINLKSHEIVNMRVARHLNSPVLLAVDIDQGGSFAFLYGTLKLLPLEEQELIKGFLFNKFRGDKKLLEPGLTMLADLTDGRPTLGVIPLIENLKLAQEDSLFIENNRIFGSGKIDIAVINYPRMANYDDLDGLTLEKGLQIRFVSSPEELGNPTAIILPGSKSTRADMTWLEKTGLAWRIKESASRGVSVGGICGGYQMMGEVISDPLGVEGTPGTTGGLRLLPLETIIEKEKKTRQATMKLDSQHKIKGYEIHMGRTKVKPGCKALFLDSDTLLPEGAQRKEGTIWGTYLHGLFDSPHFRREWLSRIGWSCSESSSKGLSLSEEREQELDRLADAVEAHSKMDEIYRIAGI